MGIGVAVAVAGVAVSAASLGEKIASGSGSGGASGGVSSGGSGATAGNANNNLNDTVNPIYGVHVGTTPLQGEKASKPQELPAPKADKGTTASWRQTPTQGAEQNAASAKSDYQNQWADRLSRYLDYNTRSLG